MRCSTFEVTFEDPAIEAAETYGKNGHPQRLRRLLDAVDAFESAPSEDDTVTILHREGRWSVAVVPARRKLDRGDDAAFLVRLDESTCQATALRFLSHRGQWAWDDLRGEAEAIVRSARGKGHA